MLSLSYIEALEKIVGIDNVYADPLDCICYSRDMSLHEGIPDAVVFTHTTGSLKNPLPC
jgi:hypothetical protein